MNSPSESQTVVVSDKDIPANLLDGGRSEWRSSPQFDWSEIQFTQKDVDRMAKIAFAVLVIFVVGVTTLGGVLLYLLLSIIFALLAKTAAIFFPAAARI